MFEWIADPTIWAGLLTLVVLEIVLGIDNLIFIAILADKLPPEQRDRARIVGLSLALLMRLALLASISWLVTLTQPLFSIYGLAPSGRDLILFIGGLFLLFKGTMELHDRLEGNSEEHTGPRMYAGFAAVVTQIVVLDAVFSLDAVITAVGMVEHLPVMMAAVTIAIGIMVVASKPLTAFVNSHPTVVILCLGFLLMIGFSLVAEGLGFHIPKGYLYAAIGFSLLIEILNQFASFNRRRFLSGNRPLRERTAEAVLKLLGGRPEPALVGADVAAITAPGDQGAVFDPVERDMIHSVLQLADRSVESLMTPRPDIVWLDASAPVEKIRQVIDEHRYNRFLVADRELDELLGVVETRELLAHLLAGNELDLRAIVKSQPLALTERMSALRALEELRRHAVPVAVVVDEYGGVEGMITASDVLAAIAGELAYIDGVEAPMVEPRGEDAWLLNGSLPSDRLKQLLALEALPQDGDFHTLGGLVLAELGRVPREGDAFELADYRFQVEQMAGHRVAKVLVTRIAGGAAAA